MCSASREYEVRLRKPHHRQQEFLRSPAKRKVICAGRRSGKTAGAAILGVERFLGGGRVLYAAPTAEQCDKFWSEVKRALMPLIDTGIFYKSEAERFIELKGTDQRIRVKTAWNADTLRGDYADLLILDEFQLMDESAWEDVGVPMLLDKDGDAVFIYTPPSRHSRSATKARDPRHASKLFAKARLDTTRRWAVFHFSSFDNPHISSEALADIRADMTMLSFRQEIMAEDIEEVPGALWKRETIERHRVLQMPELVRIVVAIDPSTTSKQTSDEAGIVLVGLGTDDHAYVLGDYSLRATPDGWARVAVSLYQTWRADCILAETNQGGDMVELVLRTIDKTVSYKSITASRGKLTRAEPIAALYEQGKVHHVGEFPQLEDELCSSLLGAPSPNRLDAAVYALTELMLRSRYIENWRAI